MKQLVNYYKRQKNKDYVININSFIFLAIGRKGIATLCLRKEVILQLQRELNKIRK